ncbi:MAG: von Willebrand factor type A domain-containing protein [Polyangiaceae bacterium]
MIDERREGRPTAYVLGEMTAEEKAQFEAEMAANPDLRAEVEDAREMASLLEGALGQGKGELPAEMRSRIESAVKESRKGPSGDKPAPVIPLPFEKKGSIRSTLLAMGVTGLLAAAAASLLVFPRMMSKDAESAAPRPYFSDNKPAATASYAPAPTAVAASPTAAATWAPEPVPGPGLVTRPQPARDAQAPGDKYEDVVDNPFLDPTKAPLSTFSIDVDTASYALVRSHLQSGSLPPPAAVRIEEMINYFDYGYPEPDDEVPFTVQLDVGHAPWALDHELVRVAIKGKTMSTRAMDGVNLVFLVDTSGSMNQPNKLPLLKQGLRMLVDRLHPEDRVAIVAYAGSAGLVLPSTPVSERATVLGALDRLSAGGSTNGGAGIDLAYKVAADHFVRGGVNRVMLATDGDFNVGTTSQDALVNLIQDKAKTGIFLTVLGFGRGNFNDALLEKIADKGNGQYAYIDNETEARRALADNLGALVTIAKDVKLQIEWNPAEVQSYRLIGYENRVMAARDFNDDRKDAGDLGSGHTVTALYEIVPAGGSGGTPLKYQAPQGGSGSRGEVCTVKLRYKEPDGQTSKLIEKTLQDDDVPVARMSADFKFAAAVASFGMLLRGSRYAGDANMISVIGLAQESAGEDTKRLEFVSMVRRAMTLSHR